MKYINTELPKGITVRKYKNGTETIYITFTFKGMTCREAIKRVSVNKKTLKYAINLKGEVENSIAQQRFNYSEYFPESKTQTAKLFGTVRNNITVKQIFDDVKWNDIVPKKTTAYTYQKDSKWAKEYLGHIPVEELTVKDVRDWIKSMNHLKRKTISNRLTPLRTVLAIAVDDQIIAINPADIVSVGIKSKGLITRKQRESDQNIDCFDTEEIERILKTAEIYHIRALNYFEVAFYTGLRPSELKGLKWLDKDGNENVDLKNGTISINSVLVSLGAKEFTQTPKTTKSNRIIELTPRALKSLKRQENETRLNSEYIFTQLDGTKGHLAHNDDYAKPWKEILEKANVRYRPAKQIRHTFTSQMLAGGENPAFIAEQLGHEDLEMIFKVYGKWIKNNKRSKHVFMSDFGQ